MSFDIAEFIKESNLIDRQPNYAKNEWIPGEKPGDLMFDNQLRAYELAIEKAQNQNLNASDVQDIHRELSRNVDFFEMQGASGTWRRCDVYISTPDKDIEFAPVWQLHWLMHEVWTPFYADCMEKAKSVDEEDKAQLAFDIHDLFECIHPFLDGNGRTGRILLNAARTQMGLEPITIMYNNRWKYYSKINVFRDTKYKETVSKYNIHEIKI